MTFVLQTTGLKLLSILKHALEIITRSLTSQSSKHFGKLIINVSLLIIMVRSSLYLQWFPDRLIFSTGDILFYRDKRGQAIRRPLANIESKSQVSI